MKNPGEFGPPRRPAVHSSPEPLDCAGVELWLAESAEKMAPRSAAAVSAHAQECPGCQEKLKQARRGREWLLVLKRESLDPPTNLVAKILARTSLAGAPGMGDVAASAAGRPARAGEASSAGHPLLYPSPGPGPVGSGDFRTEQDAIWHIADRTWSADAEPAGLSGYASAQTAIPVDSALPTWQLSSAVVLRRTLLEPRLALVAAMAFFSISLTLNLMGVKLSTLRIADFAPRNLHRAVVRQYADTNARVARYYENLRIVYEVEARVQQLRRAAATPPDSDQETKPGEKSSHSDRGQDRNSNSDFSSGQAPSHRQRMAAAPPKPENRHPDPQPLLTGPQMDVSFHPQAQLSSRLPATILERAWSPQSFAHTLATSFTLRTLPPVPAGFKFALSAPSCPRPSMFFARRDLSTPERRLA